MATPCERGLFHEGMQKIRPCRGMSGPRNRRPSPAMGMRRSHSRPRSRGRCPSHCASVVEPIKSVTESEAILAPLISDAGEAFLENVDYNLEDTQTLESDADLDEDAELYECGVEFVGSVIKDVLDEEDFDDDEAHQVFEAAEAPIAEGEEGEEEDDDVCIHQATTVDCFGAYEEQKSSATKLLLKALDDGRLETALKEEPSEYKEQKSSAMKLLLKSLDDGRLEASIKEVMQQKKGVTPPHVQVNKVLVDALHNGSLAAALTSAKQTEEQTAAASVKSTLIRALEDNSLEGALKSAKQVTPPHVQVNKVLVDALNNGSLAAAITSAKQTEEQTAAARVKSTLIGALKDDSLEGAVRLAKQKEPEQKQVPKQEEEQDLPRFRVRPAFRPENTFFFEMMCNMLDCSLDGVGRSIFPEKDEEAEEAEEVSLPSTTSLAPCTRRAFARRLVPTGSSAPVPAENFPMDCLPPLDQTTFAGVLSEPSVLPEASASAFDPLCCQSAGHVVQGVQWFSPCRSGLQFPKEEALRCPELVCDRQKLGQDDAATRIQKAFREHQARAIQSNYSAELKKIQQLAAQLAAPVVSQSPAVPSETSVLVPTAPTAPKSPRKVRRVRPSTTSQPSEGATSFAKESEMARMLPQAPSVAAPKSSPTRKRRPVPAEIHTFRMDTDTEEAPSKQAKESDLAKEFMALDAQLYSLDAPSKPVTPRASQKSPRASGAKPISALMLDLAEDSKDMRHARCSAATQQKQRGEAISSFAATAFSTGTTPFTEAAPSKRALSLGSKQGLQGGKVLPALTPRRSHALVESGNRMANQVSMTSTPRDRYL